MDFTAIARQVGTIFKEKNLRLATAESCTGGWVAQTLTAIDGCSIWFDRGYITYSNQSKHDLLAVPEQTLQVFGAVSRQTALAMADGVLANSGVNIALSVTGIAGPSGGTRDKPVGTVWFAWASRDGISDSQCQCFTGDRYQIRAQAVEYVLCQLMTFVMQR